MRHGSLFSGIGGFDLAAEWMGWENVFHCEWNEFGQKVLKYYWPKAISYADITKTDFTIHRGTIDILTGGFPCQPYSQAGKRKGKEDDRHLWPEMLRAIREIQPKYIVGENVLGIVNWNGGVVFNEVQTDLEAAGYEVQPFILPACGKNAPHRRERVWFVAYAIDSRHKARREPETEEDGISGIGRKTMDTRQFNGTSVSSVITNSDSNGQYRGDSQDEVNASEGGQYAQCDAIEGINDGNVANSDNEFIQRRPENGNIRSIRQKPNQQPERLFNCTDWRSFPTQPPICDGNNGVPAKLDGITFSKWRNESIKAGGNAVVPQVVHQIFKAIEQYELTII